MIKRQNIKAPVFILFIILMFHCSLLSLSFTGKEAMYTKQAVKHSQLKTVPHHNLLTSYNFKRKT